MKLFNLTYNELMKQFKKPSIKFMFVLILLSAIVLPLVASKTLSGEPVKVELDNNQFVLEHAQSEAEALKEEQSVKGKILYQTALIEQDHRQLIVDYRIGEKDWRGTLAEHLKDVHSELAALVFVKEGYEKEVLLENLYGVDPEKVKNFYDMTEQERIVAEKDLRAKKEVYRKIIDTQDYKAYIEVEIALKKIQIKTFEDTIERYEASKAKNPSNTVEKEQLEQLGKNIDKVKVSLVNSKQDLEILNFRLEKEIDYDKNNWKSNAIMTLEKELTDLRMPLMAEKEYNTYGTPSGYTMVYEDYVKNQEKINKQRADQIKVIGYGLQHDIPSLTDLLDGRSVMDATYEIYIILAVIMVIIIGGGIVATEFSKGTIRLLLIRPATRWKILLSKLLAVLVVGLSVVILGVGTLYLSTGMRFGFETYNTPLLKLVNDSIVPIHFFNYLIPKVIVSSASLVFIASFVFALSTLTRNTALAVALSMLMYLATPSVTDVLLNMKQTWIIQTIIPYINGSYFRLMTETTETLSSQFGMYMQYEKGAVQLLILSFVLGVITFTIFTKRDIKN